jgi:hypothetical protein
MAFCKMTFCVFFSTVPPFFVVPPFMNIAARNDFGGRGLVFFDDLRNINERLSIFNQFGGIGWCSELSGVEA